MDVTLKPVEELIFRSDIVAIGSFRCPVTHPLFRDSGPCSHHTFVFPRTATGICREGERTFIAAPGMVTCYNQSQVSIEDVRIEIDDRVAEVPCRIARDQPRHPLLRRSGAHHPHAVRETRTRRATRERRSLVSATRE